MDFLADCRTSFKTVTRGRTKNIAVLKEINGMQTVRRCFGSPMAILVVSAAVGLIRDAPAANRELPAAAPAVSTARAETTDLTRPVLLETATPQIFTSMFMTKLKGIDRPMFNPDYVIPAGEGPCGIIAATLLYKDGPNGGWCWLITTECGDQYPKGDCWYTDPISEILSPNR
jgi:hypothetical protein